MRQLFCGTKSHVDVIIPFVTVQVSAPDKRGKMTPLRALHADLLALSQEEREQAGNNLVVATAPDDLLHAGAQPEDSWTIRMLVRRGEASRQACLTCLFCLAKPADCLGPSPHLHQPEGCARANSGTTFSIIPFQKGLHFCTDFPCTSV